MMDSSRLSFSTSRNAVVQDTVPSSSPAFGTPPARPVRVGKPTSLAGKVSTLPILLPPPTLRPVAFRTFTRKHNLTITSNTLQLLATYVGKNCGSGWREEGLAERVLDEVAKMWRKSGGGVIVEEGNGASIKAILQTLESNMINGRVVIGKVSDREDASGRSQVHGVSESEVGALTQRSNYNNDPLDEDEEQDETHSKDPRAWITIISAFEQPRLVYNANKKHFEASISKPSLFPEPSHQITMLRDRYNLVYQRLLRNESFQAPVFGRYEDSSLSSSAINSRQSYKLTPIANLLGRSGTSHLLLGLLATSPAGELSLTDLTGSVLLDMTHARSVPENGAWFTPGMIVLVDGIYEEEENIRKSALGGTGGVGGAIGGIFVGISIAGPPCERREATLGMGNSHSDGDVGASSGFGWVDFLGVGSERAQGPRMRRLEAKYLRQEPNAGRRTMVIMSEVKLDNTKTFEALKKVFKTYSDLPLMELPLVFFMIGNFVENAVVGEGGHGKSIEYKEYFDSLAHVLSEFPSLLRHSTFVFVPGDNDPWPSTFSAGAATAVPREAIPELFTSRVKRAFSVGNNDSELSSFQSIPGEAVWTSNPSRLCLFGPAHEIVVFRDDISGRLRRSAVNSGNKTNEPDRATLGEERDRSHESSLKDNPLDRDIAEEKDLRTGSPEGNQRNEANSSHAMLAARKLVKTLLDQGNMSPFPFNSRPILWDYASSLQLYPLPTAFILADAEAPPFAITYEGCHVMNPGRLLPEGKRNLSRWIEYDVLRNRGRVREQRH
jgi:DNA polymerase epsilon subunit 2